MATYNAQDLLQFIDLTSLNYDDDAISINQLLSYAHSDQGNVAAICVYAKFLPLVAEFINCHQLPINLATVINFPDGGINCLQIEYDIIDAINAGANEIDIVLPYKKLMVGDEESIINVLKTARNATKDKVLKIIIESGELSSNHLIKLASELCIEYEADFIKTSTGKTLIGATIEAAQVILNVIKNSDSKCGLKVSGGISTLETAFEYYNLFANTLGKSELTADRFRIGTSKLVKIILEESVCSSKHI
jgi:deoxyribose-phosphate aldolase